MQEQSSPTSSYGGYRPLKSGKTTTQTGDVVSDWNGDGVFTGRESHNTQHSNEILLHHRACAAVIGASLTAVTPAFAGYYNFNSNRIGGATYTNGYGSNGYSFNGSSRRIGGATYFNGSDSYGNSYNGNCRRIGSFTNCSMY